MDTTLDTAICEQHLKRLFDIWNGEAKSALEIPATVVSVPVLAIVAGKSNDEVVYQKTNSLQTWLFGYEIDETAMLITKKGVVILASPKKAKFFEPLKGVCDNLSISCDIIPRTKEEEDNQMNKLIETLQSAQTDSDSKKVGVLPKDIYEGAFIEKWKSKLGASGLEQVDISPLLSASFANKDNQELASSRLASLISSRVFRYVVDRMETIIDTNKTVTHSDFAAEIEDLLENLGSKAKELKIPSEANVDNVDFCYTPIIQSGGMYDLKPSAVSNDKPMRFDTIVISLGNRYKSYCSNISRSFLVSPTKEQEKTYEFLCSVYEYVIDNLRPGNRLSKLFEDTLNFIRQQKPALEKNFVKSIGSSIGLEFRESPLVINAKNNTIIQNNMVFNISVGFSDLKYKDKSGKERTYALLIADTLEVTSGHPKKLTEYATKYADISYDLSEVDSPEKKVKEEVKRESKPVVDVLGPAASVALESRRRTAQTSASDKEDRRRTHQRELFEELNRRGMENYSKSGKAGSKDKVKEVKKFESYKSAKSLPTEYTKFQKVFVDKARETLILPIFGTPTPFHVATIKSVSLVSKDAGDYAFLRVNFHTPGQISGKDSVPFSDPNKQFVREVIYRCASQKNFNEVSKAIKDMIKLAKDRETQQREKEGVVTQDNLILSRNRIVLPDVYIRPVIETRKMLGSLEIHENGVRYRSAKGENLDILFSNMKHVFFQPCTGETMVIIHFHLIHPIMVGKKKAQDIQVYREVVDGGADETFGRKRHSMYRDDVEEEEEERRRRKANDREFREFTEKIGEMSKGLVKPDRPYRDLAFNGVPFRSNVLIQPTAYALVHLVEPPFLVVTIEDVEVASLERVQLGLREFDLVFIFKDLKRPPVHINSIPSKFLDQVQEWLDENDIPYGVGVPNLLWPKILKHVADDPYTWYEEGGWVNVLGGDMESGEEEGEDSDDVSESDFEPSESEYEESSEVSEDDSLVESSDFETPSEDSSSDWSGEDEEESSDDDRGRRNTKRRRDDSDDDRPKKKGGKPVPVRGRR